MTMVLTCVPAVITMSLIIVLSLLLNIIVQIVEKLLEEKIIFYLEEKDLLEYLIINNIESII